MNCMIEESMKDELMAMLNLMKLTKPDVYQKPLETTANGDIICPSCNKTIFHTDPYFCLENQCRNCGLPFASSIRR